MKTIYNTINGLLRNAQESLVSFMKEHGGFIDTQQRGDNENNDAIYAVELGDGDSEAREMFVLAVALDKKQDGSQGDRILVFLAPIMNTWKTEIDNWNEEISSDSGHWAYLDGGDVYFNHTLMNILESIEQYV